MRRAVAPPVVEPGGPEDVGNLYDLPCSLDPQCANVTITGTPDVQYHVPGAVYPTPAPPFMGTPSGSSSRPQPRSSYRPKPKGPGIAGLDLALPLLGVTALPGATAAELATGEEILADLLDTTFRPAPGSPQSLLEELLNRAPKTDLERLLEKPMAPRGAAVLEEAALPFGGRLLGLIGGLFSGVGLALYAQDAGLSAEEENLRVIADLAPPIGPTGTATLGTEGQPDTDRPKPLLPIVAYPVVSDVVVTATPASAPVAVPVAFTAPGIGLDVGVVPFPATATATKPAVATATRTELATITSPAAITGLTPGFFKPPQPKVGQRARTLTGPLTLPNLQLNNPTEKCSCKKKKEQKDKKKKKKREVCYRGTYVEHPTYLSKRRKEKVPCQ